jgi:putative ABC transport system permease protein
MDIAAAELAFTRPGLVNRVDVVVHREADVWNVADAITAILPPGLRVEAPAQRKADLQKVMQSIQIALQAVGYFGLVAAFLIAFSRLTAVFEARAWELAVLRAAGVRAGVVWWELTKESLAVACAGVLLGIPAGIGLGRLMLPIIATTTALSSKLIVANVEATVQWRSVLLAASVGVGAVFLAALLPAWRAARVPVVDSLRARRVELTSDATWGSSWMRVLVLVVAVLCLGLHIATESASVGLAATACCAVASAAFARPMLAWLGGPLLLFGPRVFGAPGKFAIATLLASPRRTALAISTIGVGFGTVLWWWIVAASFERSVLEVMPGVLRGDLAVSSANIGAGYLEAPVDESLVSELTAIPGVRAAAGERAIDWALAGNMIAINAFDPAYFNDPAFGEWPLVGRHLPDAADAVARGEAVLVSENFVRHLKMGVGDVVTLETPTGPLQLRIAGVTRDFLSPRGTIEMSRETYRTHWRDPHLLRALVRIAPGEDQDRVKQAIAASLGRRYSLKIISIRDLIDWFVEQVHRAFAAFHVLGLLVLVLVMVGVGDALAAGTLERTRDFGVIRAVGIRRRLLARTVLTEALVLGLLGFALALALGSTLGLLWVTETFPALLGWTLVLDVPGARIAGVAVAILVACLLSGYVPAARAARLNPVVALRTE